MILLKQLIRSWKAERNRLAHLSKIIHSEWIKMSAITASEKVDGFTRKSMRKAQKQKKSQGSSQFRTQSSCVELSPLPQLKGKRMNGAWNSRSTIVSRYLIVVSVKSGHGKIWIACLSILFANQTAPLLLTLHILVTFYVMPSLNSRSDTCWQNWPDCPRATAMTKSAVVSPANFQGWNVRPGFLEVCHKLYFCRAMLHRVLSTVL